MTNKERIYNLETNEMVKELHELFHHPLGTYINYDKYFESTDPDVLSAISVIGTAKKKPSLMEIQAIRNEHKIEPDLDKKLDDFIKENTLPCLLLERTEMFGQPYWTIVDPENKNHIVKTPDDNITDIVLYNA